MNTIKQLAQRVGSWLFRWGAMPSAEPYQPPVMTDAAAAALRAVFVKPDTSPQVLNMVHAACVNLGLPAHLCDAETFNLSHTGKLHEVLHLASQYLDVDHELRTVGDVVKHLAQRM